MMSNQRRGGMPSNPIFRMKAMFRSYLDAGNAAE